MTTSSKRDAVVHEALALIAERGVDAGLNVKEIAQRAGVSPNAPYIYFPGRHDQLLAAVAILGFMDLNKAMALPGTTDPLEWVRMVTGAYVKWGVENPNVYRAMFHGRLVYHLAGVSKEAARIDIIGRTFADLNAVKAEAYELLIAPLRAIAAVGKSRSNDPEHHGLALAALAHGLVGEFIDEGLLADATTRETPWSPERQAMTIEVTDMLLFGIVRADS